MKISTLFIVGVGRSGTSLLYSMFAAHPLISCLPETAFIRRIISNFRLQSVYEKHGQQAVLQRLKKDDYFERTNLEAAGVVERAKGRSGLLDAAVYLEMLASYEGENKTWIGDKDPRTIEYLPLLTALMPETHVIHVYRDPRDVLASKKKAGWSKKSHVWKHIFANRVQFAIGTSIGPKLFGNKYHEICYEELLNAPEKVLSRLCRNLGLEYDQNMLSFGEAAQKLVSNDELSWKKETFGPLLPENKEKWKKELHPREVMLTELCCGQAMVRGGYKNDKQRLRISLRDRLWVQAGRLLIVLATWPYILFRNFRVKRACKRIG